MKGMTPMVTTQHRLAIVAALMASVALAGCSSGQSQQAAAAPPPTPAPAPAPPPAAPPPAPVKPMSHHDLIAAVQTALNSNGAQLTADGRDGPKTHAALRAYQKQHNLKVTGRPDPATLQALGIQQ
jgi:peptidoglycan hydrolase-like protein with peptidoglycan-binding domain